MKITPTCRYGHGPLEKQDGKWSMSEVMYAKPDESFSKIQPDVKVVANQTGKLFVANLFICSQCGYTEIHDDMEAPEV